MYPQRFLNLLLLSLLNFISDWQCYSIAPVGDFVEEKYEGLHSEVSGRLGIEGSMMKYLKPFIHLTTATEHVQNVRGPTLK